MFEIDAEAPQYQTLRELQQMIVEVEPNLSEYPQQVRLVDNQGRPATTATTAGPTYIAPDVSFDGYSVGYAMPPPPPPPRTRGSSSGNSRR